jgi:hypothetical protein
VKPLLCVAVATLERLLHRHRALDRLRRRGEGDHQAVARVLDLLAARRGQRVAQQGEVLFAQLICSHRAHRGGQASRADQVGQQDRRKLDRLRH